MGTWFSDKYAEGTIGHRFYAGCDNVDTVEALAAERARELLRQHAYVQPHIRASMPTWWRSGRSSDCACRAPPSRASGRKTVDERSRMDDCEGSLRRRRSGTSGCWACR